MANNSNSYSWSTNDDTLRLSIDSNEALDNNNNIVQQHSKQSTPSRKTNQTNSGYVTRSTKSGLVFSVSRVENQLRKGRYAERIGSQASVYLASVLEYLVAEIIELAGDMTRNGKRKRITPRDIALVIKNDHELAKLCSNVTIPEGGVQPFIHQILLKPNQRRRNRTRHVTFSETLSTTNDDNLSSDVDDNELQME